MKQIGMGFAVRVGYGHRGRVAYGKVVMLDYGPGVTTAMLDSKNPPPVLNVGVVFNGQDRVRNFKTVDCEF